MDLISITHWVALGLTGVAAVTDARSGHIPNWLTLPALFSAPILAGMTMGSGGLLLSVTGLIACGFVPFCMFRAGAMGGGDVKLLAAVGAWTGPFVGLEVQLCSLLLATGFVLCRLAWRGNLKAAAKRTLLVAINPLRPAAKRVKPSEDLLTAIRLGVPIFVATLYIVVTRMAFG